MGTRFVRNLGTKEKIISFFNAAGCFLTSRRLFLYALTLALFGWFLFLKLSLSTTADQIAGRDFVAFYTAATLGRYHPTEVYDTDAQFRFQQHLTPPSWHGVHWHYLNPPFFTLGLVPLAYFSYAEAFWIWTLISLLLYFLSIVILVSVLGEPDLGRALAIAAAAPALLWVTLTGQTTALAFFCWSLGYAAFRRGRLLLSGLILGLLFYRVQYLAALLPLFLLKRLWTVLFGLSISLLALVVAGGIGFSFGSYFEYMNVLRLFSQRIFDQSQPLGHHISIYGFFGPLFSHDWAFILSTAASLMLLYWLVKTWQGPAEAEETRTDLQFAMLIISTLLLMHHSLVYDLLLVAIPALLVSRHKELFPRHHRVLFTLVYLSPYALLTFPHRSGFNPVALLLFYLSFEIYTAYRRTERSETN